MASFSLFGSSLSPLAKHFPPITFWGTSHFTKSLSLSYSPSPSLSFSRLARITPSRTRDRWISGPINSKARGNQDWWVSGLPAERAAIIMHVGLLLGHFFGVPFNTLMNKALEAVHHLVMVTPHQFNLGHFAAGLGFILAWTFVAYTFGRNSATKGPNIAPVSYGSGVATMNCCGNRHAPACNCCVTGAREGEAPPAQPIFIVPSPGQPIFIVPGNNMFFNLNFYSGWSYTNRNFSKF